MLSVLSVWSDCFAAAVVIVLSKEPGMTDCLSGVNMSCNLVGCGCVSMKRAVKYLWYLEECSTKVPTDCCVQRQRYARWQQGRQVSHVEHVAVLRCWYDFLFELKVVSGSPAFVRE